MVKGFKRVLIPVTTVFVAMLASSVGPVSADSGVDKKVDITVDGQKITIKTDSKLVKEVLADAEHKYKASDEINYELNERVKGKMDIVISSEKKVSLSTKDGSKELVTNADTVEDFLKEADVKVGEKDIVIPSLESKLEKEEEILVIQFEEEIYKKNTEIDFKVENEFSMDLPYGTVKTVVKGEKGSIETTFKKETKNGIVVSEKKVSERIAKEAINEKVLIGTKEVINNQLDFKTITRDSNSIYKGQSKVVQQGKKGTEQIVYENDGATRSLVSQEIIQKPVDKIIENGTKDYPKPTVKTYTSSSPTQTSSPTVKTSSPAVKTSSPAVQVSNSSAKYTLAQFKFNGVIHANGKKFTYYSQSVLPGGGLKIPGRHLNSAGFVSDGSGYIVLAANRSIPKGSIINTPFGAQGKVYDTCAGCSIEWYDVYVK